MRLRRSAPTGSATTAAAAGPVAALLLAVVVLSSCGARGDDPTAATGPQAPPSTTTAPAAARFGTLASPCGPGAARVRAGEGPASPGEIVLGVANDRSSTIRPGLNRELWDASNAFARWCNDQGGIAGLAIRLVDLDAQILQVQTAMAKACTGVFAMVGGGFVQDDLEFTGQTGTDFHKCALIDVPAFAVSVAKSESNGQAQPLPNPAYRRPTAWIEDFKKLYPVEAAKNVVVYGDLPTLVAVKASYEAAVEAVGGIEALTPISYPVAGLIDWGPLADRVIASGAGSVHFLGEPDNLANIMAALRLKNWRGKVLNETNIYGDRVLAKGAAAVEGIVVRLPFTPFEEASTNPALQQYLDNLRAYDPEAKAASLGIQSTSAWLLFASAATKCAADNAGVIDRTCILTTARTFTDWTAGGLHAPSAAGSPDPTRCGLLVVARNGKWQRLYPEVGGTDDDRDGYHCPDPGIARVTADIGRGAVDPTRPG